MKRRGFPVHVSEYEDRHGRWRVRYRRKGQPTYYFKSAFGTPEFEMELASCRAGKPVDPAVRRFAAGTIGDLVTRFFSSAEFKAGGPTTQEKNRGILDRFRDAYGNRSVATIRFDHIEAIILKKAELHPAAARNLKKQLSRLFRYAVKLGMRPDNPVDIVAPLRGHASTGFHTWTESEIDQYRSTWALGTKQRLALELLLWTGQRRSDVVRMGPAMVAHGRIVVTQVKMMNRNRAPLAIKITPQLADAIRQTRLTGHTTYLVTDYGKPFSSDGFGNAFKDWCRKAGLPHCSAHGLRKALARRGGELGASNLQLKSVGGWTDDRQVATYTAAANQMILADDTLAMVSEWEANLGTGLANTDEKTP